MGTRAPRQRRSAGTAPAVGAATSLVSLMLLSGLTFGVPVLLFLFGRDQFPSTVVKPGVMWEALKQPDDGHIFLQGLYLVAWAGWFVFFLSVFLEIVGQVQHRAAVRLPGLGWLQRGVGTLVTAAVVILGSPVAAMAAAPAAPYQGAGPVATAQAFAQGVDLATQSALSHSAHPAMGPPYTVRAGDSLWRIAQDRLGNPNRFEEIARLNDGRVMSDGTVFHYAEFLRPGWVLLMPADAGQHDSHVGSHDGSRYGDHDGDRHGTGASVVLDTSQALPTAAGPQADRNAEPRTYTVQSGDTLSTIAQAQLGDADRWSELFRLNQGRAQPDGQPIEQPNLIWPGDVLLLPGSVPSSPGMGAAATTPSATGAEQAPEQVSQGSGSQIVLGPQGERVRPEPPALDTPAHGSSASNPMAGDFGIGTGDESGKTLGTVGGLLAAGLLTALGSRRLARLRHRRPGQRIRVAAPDDWELELHSIENPTGRVFIDVALRTLAARLAEVDRILPDVAATVLKPHGLELHLARPEAAVEPFHSVPERPGVWICPIDSPLLTEGSGLPAQAPYPSLVTFGFDEDDDSVLVDLEATRGLSLLTPVPESVAMLRAMAVELATETWAEHISVTLVGFGAELPSLFTPGRMTHTTDLTAAVDSLLDWSDEVEAVLDRHDVSLREARTYPDPDVLPITRTRVLLSAEPLDPRSAYRLRQLLSGHQRTSVAVAAVVEDSDHLLSQWVVTGPAFQTPQPAGGGPALKVRMQALRDEPYYAIVRDLSGTDLDDEWASAQHQGFGGGMQSRPAPDRSPGTGRRSSSVASADRPGASAAPRVPAVDTPDPAGSGRFRIAMNDLFRVGSLPAPEPEAVPAPGASGKARHALIPANLPQFDVVVTPWPGKSGGIPVLAVPNAAPAPRPTRSVGLTTFDVLTQLGGANGPAAGHAAAPEAPGRAGQRPGHGPASGPATHVGHVGHGAHDGSQHSAAQPRHGAPKRPGDWQSAYWNQRRVARDQQQNLEVEPAAMARSVDVLGPIDLAGTPASAGSRTADLAEVAAYVMLHPGCTAAQVAADLWPGRTGAATIRDAQVSRLREWLGTDAYGTDHLQVTPEGYFMGSSVTCDWLEFLRRVHDGELVSAISLIRGRPFQGAPLRRYGWAEGLRHEMTALCIDTAHYVAEACLRERNPRGAQNAAYRGLQAAPESELLYRDLLTALAEQGDLAGARHHADTLIAYADREGIDLQRETTDLLRDVLQAVPGV